MKKEYSQLTFVDDFMFCKILTSDTDLCKGLLELTLGLKIKDIKINQDQLSIEKKYDARGIRLDVYIEDENETVYDIEMQTTLKKDLPKRTRYYQGMIDLNLIGRGAKFGELKKTYIIFICTEDPFGKELPVYTFDNCCRECPELILGDEATKVIVNADGRRDGLSSEMTAFLDFLKNGKGNTVFTSKLEEAVKSAKNHREWEVEYMTLFAKIQEEREEAAIKQLIETSHKYHATNEEIKADIIEKFHLSEVEAEKCIREYDLQPV